MRERAGRFFRHTHYLLLGCCALLSGLSVLTLFAVGQYGGLRLEGLFGDFRPALTQILATALGLAAALVVSALDYRRLAGCWPLHLACWVLVLLTFIPGVGYEPPGTGSRSWIAMPFGMSFQPTEIAKISFILTFAAHLARVKDTLNRPKSLAGLLLHLALPAVLVHFQGDDGTAIVFLAIGLGMLVAAGLNRWVVAGCAGAAAVAAPFVWQYVMTAHQRQRIIGLFFPDFYTDTIMYQQLQSRQAITGGGLLGRGLFQPEHHYVPRSENDFIFSFFAESWGFLGALVLLGLLLAVMVIVLRVAYRSADRCGAFLCVGVFMTLLFQSTVNLGMNLLLLPVMGVTLPFFSAGGTSVAMLYICVGLVMSVHRRAAQPLRPTFLAAQGA